MQETERNQLSNQQRTHGRCHFVWCLRPVDIEWWILFIWLHIWINSVANVKRQLRRNGSSIGVSERQLVIICLCIAFDVSSLKWRLFCWVGNWFDDFKMTFTLVIIASQAAQEQAQMKAIHNFEEIKSPCTLRCIFFSWLRVERDSHL